MTGRAALIVAILLLAMLGADVGLRAAFLFGTPTPIYARVGLHDNDNAHRSAVVAPSSDIKWTDYVAAAATVALAFLGVFQLLTFLGQRDILKQQTEIARQTFYASHRPRLLIREVRMFLEPAPVKMTWRVINTGAVKAHVFNVEARFTVNTTLRMSPSGSSSFMTRPTNLEDFDLDAGGTKDMKVSFDPEISELFLSSKTISGIAAFESYMAYRATPDQSYQLRICRIYDPSSGNLVRNQQSRP